MLSYVVFSLDDDDEDNEGEEPRPRNNLKQVRTRSQVNIFKMK